MPFLEKYNTKIIAAIFAAIICLSYVSYQAEQKNADARTQYEKYVDSLYQINIQIAIAYGKALDTNPNAVRPEPAIWFLDMNGNMYDYPPDKENDSIMREREVYKRRLDSLHGSQFKEVEEWYKTKHNK